MSEPIDLYWSFRSPYSYLALKQINDIAARRDVEFNVRIVHPLAIRDPEFFVSRGMPWITYLLKDVFRLGEMTEQTISIPKPDPIVQDLTNAKIAEDQPYIYRLAYLGILAAESECGLDFITTVSPIIWSGEDWTAENRLSEALGNVDIDLAALEAKISGHETELDAKLDANDKALREAGHWGVPTTVLRGEPFFGMDRLDALEWRLDQLGIS